MVGETVGNYQIVKPLSHGAFGQVFLARHTLIGRQVAVKVLHPEMSRQQDAVVRFFNEARAAATIRHPGLVDVFDFGYHPSGSGFLVMELLQGQSLATRLARGALSEDLAAGIGRQVATAIGAAHAAGIVHRDLKPDNLFLVPDPDMPDGVRVKVLDFGIAKLSDAQGVRTSTNVVMGTAWYMSPEQCTNTAGVDRRTDVYSLGCILYEMVCGHPPFPSESITQLIAAHLYQAPPPLRGLVPSLRPEFDGLVQRMLAKDPAQRPQSMEEVAAALDLLSRGKSGQRLAVAPTIGVPQGAPPTPPVPSVVKPAPPQPLAMVRAAVASLPAIAPHAASLLAPGARRGVNRAALLIGALVLVGGLALWKLIPFGPPPKAHLTIRSTPAGASVIRAADGVNLGQTPLLYEVAPAAGQVAFLLKLDGYQDASAALASDRDNEALVQLTHVPSRPTRPQGPRTKVDINIGHVGWPFHW